MFLRLSESFGRVGEVLGLNTNLMLLRKWLMSSPLSGWHFLLLFSSFACPIAGLLCSTVQLLEIIGTAFLLKHFDEA